MRMHNFLLLSLITLTGCVVTYGGSPNATLESLPRDHVPKPFFYHLSTITSDPVIVALTVPHMYPLMMVDFRERAVNEVRHTLETSTMFSELIPQDQNPPNHGTYCNIRLIAMPPSSSALGVAVGQAAPAAIVAPAALTAPVVMVLAWGLIPYYSGEGGLSVHYDLYRDGTHRETYKYMIKKKGVGGATLSSFRLAQLLHG